MSETVRAARVALALALLDERPSAPDEALSQLELAVDETGTEPPTWELYHLAANVTRPVNPHDALTRDLRAVRHGAPDSVAHELRTWVQAHPAGPRASGEDIDLLVSEPTPARLLLAGVLLRSAGNSARALETVSPLERSDPEIAGPATELTVRCLLDLGRFADAEKILEEGRGMLRRETAAVLWARLDYARRDFLAAVERLDTLTDGLGDDGAALRILAQVGAGRAADVRWADDEDAAGPEMWLSRAVAALASRRYDAAREAGNRVERTDPRSIDALLIRAQAQLEADELDEDRLAPGLAVLELVVKAVRERDADPLWLVQQRHVRQFGRFGYVECEYEHLLRGVADPKHLRDVDRTDTTFFQDGRLAELAAERLEGTVRGELEGTVRGEVARGEAEPGLEESEWIDALDNAVAAYQTAAAYGSALRLARRVFDAAPTLGRALSVGRCAYYSSYLPAQEAADADRARMADELAAACLAVERHVTPMAATDEIDNAISLLALMHARRAEKLDRGRAEVAATVTAWAFTNAIVAVGDASAQLTLEWVVRDLLGVEAASFEIAEYAGSLDPSQVEVTEARLVAHASFLGTDADTPTLRETWLNQQEAKPGGLTRSVEQWCNGLDLLLAMFDGDDEQARRLLDADVGEIPWALQVRVLAAVTLLGTTAAHPTVKEARVALNPSEEPLHSAWLAAVDAGLSKADADLSKAEDLLEDARRAGNDLPAEIDKMASVLDFLRHPDRPLVHLARDLVGAARCPGDLLWLSRLDLPSLAAATGRSLDGHLAEINAWAQERSARLRRDQSGWDVDIDTVDPTLGSLARLWQALTRRDIRRLYDGTRRHSPRAEPPAGALGVAVDHVVALASDRLPEYLLADVVGALSAGREPDGEFARQVRVERSTALTALAAAYAGAGELDYAPSEEDRQACVDAVRRAIEAADAHGEMLWRVYDATQRLAGTGAETLRRALADGLLDLLVPAVGLAAPAAPEYRSHVAFSLGDAFVPEDTGPNWILFSDYLPKLKETIEKETGWQLPGFNVRGDHTGEPGRVCMILNGAVLETYLLPTDGVLVPVGDAVDATDAGNAADGVSSRLTDAPRDPITEDRVLHVRPDEAPPATTVDTTQAWQPLEFVVRHVERFVRRHLADLVTVWDVVSLAAELGDEQAQRLSDPVVLSEWLMQTRHDLLEDVAAGIHRTPAERARRVAEQVRRSRPAAYRQAGVTSP